MSEITARGVLFPPPGTPFGENKRAGGDPIRLVISSRTRLQMPCQMARLCKRYWFSLCPDLVLHVNFPQNSAPVILLSRYLSRYAGLWTNSIV